MDAPHPRGTLTTCRIRFESRRRTRFWCRVSRGGRLAGRCPLPGSTTGGSPLGALLRREPLVPRALGGLLRTLVVLVAVVVDPVLLAAVVSVLVPLPSVVVVLVPLHAMSVVLVSVVLVSVVLVSVVLVPVLLVSVVLVSVVLVAVVLVSVVLVAVVHVSAPAVRIFASTKVAWPTAPESVVICMLLRPIVRPPAPDDAVGVGPAGVCRATKSRQVMTWSSRAFTNCAVVGAGGRLRGSNVRTPTIAPVKATTPAAPATTTRHAPTDLLTQRGRGDGAVCRTCLRVRRRPRVERATTKPHLVARCRDPLAGRATSGEPDQATGMRTSQDATTKPHGTTGVARSGLPIAG
jgi:hypothetical protein